MRKQTAIIIGLIAGLALIGPYSPALAQTSVSAIEQSRQFGAQAGMVVLDGQTYMANGEFDVGLNKLSEALSMKGLTNYERSIIYQMQGACFYELGQYDEAITAFENALATAGLNKKEKRLLEFNLAQLLIANDHFEKGARLLEVQHREGTKLKNRHLKILWQAWSKAERYDRALPWAERWFDTANTKTPTHFKTLEFLYKKLGMNKELSEIENQMSKNSPDQMKLH